MSREDKEQAQLNIDTAMELRLAGMSYRQIGDKMGVSQQSAFRYVKTAIKSIQKDYAEKAHELVTIDLAKLKQIELAMYGKVMKGDLNAIDKLLKVMERRARLLGLDAPKQIEVANKTLDITIKRADED
jgi:predicted DNA-binding protein (UPF0251 family)